MTTWASALLDPTVSIHWLLEIEAGGEVLRYADADLNVGAHPYRGALGMVSEPTLRSDPYVGETGAVSCQVELQPLMDGGPDRPLFRAHDIGDTYRVEFIGLVARVYRWAAGSAESERNLIIDGHITDANVSRESILSLGISDFSVFYSTKILPPILIDLATFPDASEDDIGRRLPLVYGAFGGLEVPQIASTGDKHGIGHHIGSIDNGRVDETNNTPALTNTALSSGVEYAELDFSISTDGLTAVVGGTGVLDDDAGTYTGTPDALLAHTADQLHHLAREIVGIPREKIDAFSFVALRAKTASLVNTIIVDADESVNFFKVASVALAPYRGTVCAEHGQLVARLLDFNAPPAAALVEGENASVVDRAEWPGFKNVPAGLELEYGKQWDRKRKKFRKMLVLSIEPADYTPFAVAMSRGATKLRVSYPYILDPTTAEALVAGIKELYAKNRRRLSVIVSRECHDLLLYETVSLTWADAPSANGEGWVEKIFAVVGIAYGTDESTLQLLEC